MLFLILSYDCFPKNTVPSTALSDDSRLDFFLRAKRTVGRTVARFNSSWATPTESRISDSFSESESQKRYQSSFIIVNRE